MKIEDGVSSFQIRRFSWDVDPRNNRGNPDKDPQHRKNISSCDGILGTDEWIFLVVTRICITETDSYNQQSNEPIHQNTSHMIAPITTAVNRSDMALSIPGVFTSDIRRRLQS